jgi:uncharacterized lipoprotein YddW (UPF0748 family)
MLRLSLLFFAVAACTPAVLSADPTAVPELTAAPAQMQRLSTPPPTVAPRPTTPPTAAPLAVPTLLPTATPVPQDAPELRAVWVDAFHDGIKSPQQVDELLRWARAANLNAVFVQVRRRGDSYYLKSIEPRSEDPKLTPGFDALQYLIEKAHAGDGLQRLQVHAWLATLPAWHKRDAPPSEPLHMLNQHGQYVDPADTWLMYRDDGEAWAGVGESGTYYLDPGNPDAMRHTVNVYLNVLRNYDVDGIHLDQVRYYEGQPLRWGYNPTSVARFLTRYGRDLESVPDPRDPEWVAWRREQVTALVRRIFLEAKAIKPHVAVSAAVVTWGRGPQSTTDWERQPPYATVLQDWRGWLQEGIVDYVLPMDYYRDVEQQAEWFDNWTRFATANTGKRAVVLGLGAYLNGGDAVLAQLGRARAQGALGVALYSYAVPTRDLEGASEGDRLAFAAQLRSAFARPAPVPPIAWLTRPANGSLLVEVPGREGVSVALVDLAGRRLVWRTDGTGVAGSAEIQPGTYTLSIGDSAESVSVLVNPGLTSVVRVIETARN